VLRVGRGLQGLAGGDVGTSSATRRGHAAVFHFTSALDDTGTSAFNQSPMKLRITQILDREICHFADATRRITSRGNRVFVESSASNYTFSLPLHKMWERLAIHFRLARRAARLDKMNVVPVAGGFCILYRGEIWRYDETEKKLTLTGRLKNCRNVLHQSICVLDGGNTLYFGEYGANTQRIEVPVWRSLDAGKSWHVVFLFPAKKIKHIHGCYYDPVEDKIWTLTGDFAGECYLLCSDRDFRNVEWIGDGMQVFRACNVFFEKNAVHWIMDSQLQDSHHIRLDRATRQIERGRMFPGPCWYVKSLADGYFLATTAVEIGPGVHDSAAHVVMTKDFKTWEDIYEFPHDRLPMRYFKFGVLAFADGTQSSDKFYLFGEAVRGLDGKIAECRLEE
jgi:hypothetical protein